MFAGAEGTNRWEHGVNESGLTEGEAASRALFALLEEVKNAAPPLEPLKAEILYRDIMARRSKVVARGRSGLGRVARFGGGWAGGVTGSLRSLTH